ncbi:MAG: nucleoside triphosphate pyrophosphohydrolase [Candidatus Dependentiae bacterium]|nr:nucleoside triphosphate pyrophosphohydrolase [Candidatus Dependentiae bacterium]
MALIRFNVDKLIRDKIPNSLRSKGVIVHERVAESEEYTELLKKKLLEEAQESIDAVDHKELAEELGDVIEVIHALAKAQNIDLATIEAVRLAKKERNGGFEDKVYCSYVDVDEANPQAAYYASRPVQYPKIDRPDK